VAERRITIPHVDPYQQGQPPEALQAAASAYGNAGLYIAPTVNRGPSPGKNPGTLLGAGWPSKTVTGGADAWALLDEHRDACGVALHAGRSGLVVVDIDTEDATLIPEPLRRAIRELRPPRSTTRIGATLRGHCLFAQPAGRHIGNSTGQLGDEWGDIRGTNGVIILPGSYHPADDGRYEWQHTGDIPTLPDYVADLLPDGAVAGAAYSDEQVEEFLTANVGNARPAALRGVIGDLVAASAHGRHAAAVRAACWAMREARAGLYPARVAADAIAHELREAVGGERDTTAEMRGIMSWAVAQAAAEAPERVTQVRARALPKPATVEAPEAPEEHDNVLPSSRAPVKAARALAARRPHLRWWRDDYYSWTGTHWACEPVPAIEQWMYAETEHADCLVPPKKDGDEPERQAWNPNKRKIGEVMHALSRLVIQRPASQDDDRVLACKNGVVDVATRQLLPHTPDRFNLSVRDFDYDSRAQCPQWLAFLRTSLPGDDAAHAFLQEWFGYVLSGRTDMHTIASLIGVRRGGKSITSSILQALVGADACTSPDITDLGSHFGRATLVGKSLAALNDVRWNSPLASEALKTLLGISGEDVMTFPRKHRDDWTGRSGVRLMTISNDTPSFADRSNALGARMIHVQFKVSFVGREDRSLEGKLRSELPGILNWALDGLARLDKTRVFTRPASDAEIAEEMTRDSNPVRTWIEEQCVSGPEHEAPSYTLLEAYTEWSDRRGERRMSLRTFHRALRDAGVRVERRKLPTGQQEQRAYGLKCPSYDPYKFAGVTLPR
jgi:putative DNA primase/helicase